MLDIGWTEIMVIAVIALVVIGPKDLPRTLAMIGKWVGKARRLAGEFQSQVNDIIKESEVENVAKEVDKMARVNIDETVRKSVDPDGALSKGLEIAEDDIFEPKDPPKTEDPKAAVPKAKDEPTGPKRSVGATASATVKKPAAKKAPTRKPAAKKAPVKTAAAAAAKTPTGKES